ncbi:MAG: hypothetical protein FWC40_04385 [Proteobacteria bacterium]|nr:hypothetical protein [Pseudomonadota bacterium]
MALSIRAAFPLFIAALVIAVVLGMSYMAGAYALSVSDWLAQPDGSRGRVRLEGNLYFDPAAPGAAQLCDAKACLALTLELPPGRTLSDGQAVIVYAKVDRGVLSVTRVLTLCQGKAQTP